MATIILRLGKGSPLTNAELDGNFTNLNNDIATKASTSSLASVAFTGSYSSLTGTPTLGTAAAKDIPATGNASATQVVYGSDTRLSDARTPTAHNQAWSTITGTPTTLSGYGITDAYNSSNPAGYITGITSSNVTTALGFTPYNATNPNGYITTAGARAAISVTGSGSYDSATGVITVTGGVTSFNTRTGAIVLLSTDVTTALGFTPYNSTNPNSYITTAGARSAISVTGSGSYDSATGVITVTGGVTSVNSRTGAVTITSGDVTGALGFTPYNNSNPSGYITSSALSGYLTSASAASTYAPLTGTGASGTWGINISGNAATATNSTTTSQTNFSNLTIGGSQVLYAGNYSSYALPLSGGTLTGAVTGTTFQGGGWTGYLNPSTAAIRGNGSYGGAIALVDGPYGIALYSITGTLNFGMGSNTAVTSKATLDGSGNFNTAGAITQNGSQVLTAGNYNSYAPTLTGTGATGTWAINISGNAATSSSTTGNAATATILKAVNVTSSTVSTWNPGALTYQAWGQAFTNSAISGDSGDITMWLRPSQYTGGGTELNMYIDGDYYSGSGLYKVLNAGNYNSYAPTLTGTGATGTWAINISGSASGNVPSSGGTMTGNLAFTQPYGVTFANGQYIKDNSAGGLIIYSGAAINLSGTSITLNSDTTLSANLYFANSGTAKRGIMGTVADNDFWFVGGAGTASNAGYMEIATGDDAQGSGTAEPIYVSQYGPGNPLTGTLVRRGSLLDANGNTSFPGTISASSFAGSLATGSGASGTWGISITGSAGSAPGYLPLTGGVMTGGVQITGQGSASNVASVTSLNLGVYGGTHAFIDLATQNVEGSWIDFTKGDGGDYGGRIRYRNAVDTFQFFAAASGTPQLTLSSYTQATGSMRAPIFYDSDDTAYYGDFASTSVFSKLTLNAKQNAVNQGIPPTSGTSTTAIQRIYAGYGTYGEVIDIGFNVLTSYGWIQATNYSNLAVNYPLLLNPNGSNVGIGLLNATPSAKLHVVQSTPTSLGGVPSGVTMISDSSTNNYLLFRNTADNGTYGGIAFQDNNIGGYVVFGNAGGGGDQLYVAGYGGGQLQQGYSDSINPGARTTIASWNPTGLQVNSGDMRAPIYYDSNNTSYYSDPSSTSVLNVVNANTITGTINGMSYDGNGISGMGPITTWDSRPAVGSAGYGINWHTGVTLSGYPGYGGVRLYASGYPTQAGSVLRLEASYGVYTYGQFTNNSRVDAPIFYDANDTNYYLDPNGTSVLNILDGPALSDSKLWLRTKGDTNHYLWNAGDDWEELVAYAGTGFRVSNSNGTGSILTCYGNINGNYVQAVGSMRAPVFYDSDNTGYYADFASTAGDCARFAGGIVVSQGNVTGNGIILADDGDIVDLNDGYCSMRFSNGVRIFSANRGGSAQVALTYQGNVIAAGNVTAYGSPSDSRLKENVKPLTGALGKVMQLQGCTFDWKEDSEQHTMVGLREDIGFIADDVKEVVPNMVRMGQDGYLSLRDRGFSALLVEAMKEQQAQIAALRAEINALRAN